MDVCAVLTRLFLAMIIACLAACDPDTPFGNQPSQSSRPPKGSGVRARNAAECLRHHGAMVVVLEGRHGPPETRVAIDAIGQDKWMLEGRVAWTGNADDFQQVLGLENVTSVVLHGEAIDDCWAVPLGALSDLQTLDMSYTSVSDAGVKQLSHLRHLELVSLAHTRITDAGLESLTALPSLRLLQLHSTRITDSGARHLAEIETLEDLALDSTLVSDDAMSHLRALSNLRNLSLRQTAVGDVGLGQISHLTRLRFLDVRETLVSDDSLRTIASLPSIERVLLAGSRVTLSGIVQLSAAKPSLELDLQLGDEGSDGILDRAYVMLSLKQYRRAVSLLHESLMRGDAVAEAHHCRALAFQGLGQLPDAQREVDQAVKISPENPEYALSRGCILLEQHRYEEAVRNSDCAMAKWPRSGRVYVQRGLIHAMLNEYEKALRYYRVSLRDIYGERLRAYIGMARIHRRRRAFDKCRELLTMAESVALNDPATHAAKGFLCLWQGNLDEAMRHFDQGVAVAPDCAIGYFDRGEAYLWAGLHEKALSDFDRAIAIDETLADAYVQRGILFSGRQQWRRAEEDFNRALKLVASHEEALAGLGLISAQRDQFDDSDAFFERAVSLNPTSAVVFVLWGQADLLRGTPERAEKNASTAIERDPHLAEAYWLRATAREQEKKLDGSREDRETACKLNPFLLSRHLKKNRSLDRQVPEE